MKNPVLLVLTLSFAILFTGCAATYRPINPPSLNYNYHDLTEGISISYQYDVLNTSANKKYARKEQKRDLRLIAVKITNNSDSAIVVNEDLFLYEGEKKVTPVEPLVIKQELGQMIPGYIPYLVLSLAYVETNDGSGLKRYPVGLAIGPPVMTGNMIMAGFSNKKFYMELLEYNLNHRTINSGETVYGLMGIKDLNYAPLNIRRE